MRKGQFLLAASLATVIVIAAVCADENREQIGTVLGEPVFRDQISTEKGFTLELELDRLFLRPVLTQYQREHSEEITPTKEELEYAADYFDAEHWERLKGEEGEDLKQRVRDLERQILDESQSLEERAALIEKLDEVFGEYHPPGLTIADFILGNWKFQRHLYVNFGGGRINFQQSGYEAFDAMHHFLKAAEESGILHITDPALRDEFFKYWTHEFQHSQSLSDDETEIESVLLNPPWIPKQEDAEHP